MTEQYYSITLDENTLQHYGVKGMKWGVRRAINKLRRMRETRYYRSEELRNRLQDRHSNKLVRKDMSKKDRKEHPYNLTKQYLNDSIARRRESAKKDTDTISNNTNARINILTKKANKRMNGASQKRKDRIMAKLNKNQRN